MVQTVYDVIIIGGGPSGSTTGAYLAKAGLRVLILEKEKFPREHVGESLLPFCYQVFEDLGVLGYMEKNYSRKPGATFSNYDGSAYSNWCFNRVINDPSYLSFHVRRADFDQMMLKNSKKLGAEVEEEVKVTNVVLDRDDSIAEVTGLNNVGEQQNYFAKFIVDASGQSTFLGKKLKSKKSMDTLDVRVAYSTHWINPNLDPVLETGNLKIVHLEGEKKGWIWMIPLKGNRISVGVALKMEYAKKRKKELAPEHEEWQEALYLKELEESKVVMNVLEDAEMVRPININGDFSYYIEKKYGHNYAMVGDSGAFLDPIFSSGVYLGIQSGKVVSEGIVKWLEDKDFSSIEKAYSDIEGAYNLVEKLIRTFYEKNSIKFTHIEKMDEYSFKKFEAAYSILHMILAGDFFTNHKKYSKAIDILKDESLMEKYRHLIKLDIDRDHATVCR